jgi:FkbH-like protein
MTLPGMTLPGMTLAEALQATRVCDADATPYQAALACGFTPLHLETYFHAYLQALDSRRKVQVRTGLFGDLIGNVERLDDGLHAAAIVIEWSDLDPRLGFRQLAGWKPSQLSRIAADLEARLRQLEAAIRGAAAKFPVTVALPSLPLPPAFHTINAKTHRTSLDMRAAIANFTVRVADAGVRVVNVEGLAADRYDLKSDLLTGFPYTQAHARGLGRLLASALASPAPKKGLITDLDDTLWSGIVGEIGPAALSWDLDRRTQIHGLYQQMLDSLSEQGVLIAAASKNDPAAVDQAFRERTDLLIDPERVYPREIGWGPKSESVARILQVWNIATDAVVFIDDSPLEVAEVQRVFPQMQCAVFPKSDPAAALSLFYRLRDWFGKDQIEADDAIRASSIRRAGELQQATTAGAAGQEEFLRGLEAEITFSVNPPASETRILELVNKTNQFNLNGVRYDDATWRRMQSQEGAITLGVSYRDKFGPLGTIAVLHGRASGGRIHVETWVMSCRAFSRRIEHQTLRFLAEQWGVTRFDFAFAVTAKNGPLQALLAELSGAAPTGGTITLSAAEFRKRCPELAHRVLIKEAEAVAR